MIFQTMVCFQFCLISLGKFQSQLHKKNGFPSLGFESWRQPHPTHLGWTGTPTVSQLWSSLMLQYLYLSYIVCSASARCSGKRNRATVVWTCIQKWEGRGRGHTGADVVHSAGLLRLVVVVEVVLFQFSWNPVVNRQDNQAAEFGRWQMESAVFWLESRNIQDTITSCAAPWLLPDEMNRLDCSRFLS